MTKKHKIKLGAESVDYNDADVLLGIWTAAFSASYVMHYRALRERFGFEMALAHTSAETAETIADKSVAEWIRWNEDEK